MIRHLFAFVPVLVFGLVLIAIARWDLRKRARERKESPQASSDR